MEQSEPLGATTEYLCWKKSSSGEFHTLPKHNMSSPNVFNTVSHGEKIEYSLFSNVLRVFKYSAIDRHLVFPVASCVSSSHQHQHTQHSKLDSSDKEILTVPGMQVKRKTVASEYQTVSEVEVKEWLEKETGFDRVRSMYLLGQDGLFVQEETRIMTKMWFRTVLMGFCFSMVATTLSHNKTKRPKNLSMSSAVQRDHSRHSLFPKAAWRQIFIGTLKLSAWSGSVLYLSQTMATYRNKSSVWEYTISSAVGFGSVALTRGLKTLAAYTLLGVGFGFIGGHLICKLMVDTSNTQEMRHTRHIQQMLQDKRMAVIGELDTNHASNKNRFSSAV